MTTPIRALLTASLTLALTACHAVPGLSPLSSGPAAVGMQDAQPTVMGSVSVAIRWPERMQPTVQAIPSAANTIWLTIARRTGEPVASESFVRPATNRGVVAIATLSVPVGTAMVVQANAFREVATGSIPSMDRVIAQGVQDNVTVSFNQTTNLHLQLDPEVTVAGIGGTAALGLNPPSPDRIAKLAGGPAAWTELLNPDHLVYDPTGRYLYFTEEPDPGRTAEGYRIVRVSMRPAAYGRIALVAGGGTLDPDRDPDTTAADTELKAPEGVAVDTAAQRTFITEPARNVIRMVGGDGSIARVAGSGAAALFDGEGTSAGFNAPKGLAITSDRSTLYVADYGNARVRQVDLQGGAFLVSTLAGGGDATATDSATSSFIPNTRVDVSSPLSVAVGNGHVYVGTETGHIVDVSLAGQHPARTLAGVGTATPGAVGAYDSHFGAIGGLAVIGTKLYFSDETNHRVWMLATASPTDVPQPILGNGAEGAGTLQLDSPRGLLAMGTNDLYVCDTGNNRIRHVLLDNPTANPAFAGRADGTGDMLNGAAGMGTLDGPTAIADAGNGVFVAVDNTSGRLRGITSQGDLSTIAGYGGNGRLARNVGTFSNRMHLSEIAGLALDRAPGHDALYAITNDKSNDSGGSAAFRINGVSSISENANDFATPYPIVNVLTETIFDNLASRLGSAGEMVIDGPTSIAVNPVDQKVVFGIANTYHAVLGWNSFSRELAYAHDNLPSQGIDLKIGTGTKGDNVDGPPDLIQLTKPRCCHYDRQGNLYFISDSSKGKALLRRMSPGPTLSLRTATIAGGGDGSVPPVGTATPIRATSATLGQVADIDLDSRGNLFIASGSKILRLDQQAGTLVELYDTGNRTLKSIAYDENDQAMYFTYTGEPKVKKVYFSRLF